MATDHITRLPFDVLDEIIACLSARDFLALTSTCKQFRETLYNDAGYWKSAATNTFRLRKRTSTDNDGILWRKLYRRLQTQTKIYMWGQASRDGNPQQIDLGTNGEHSVGIVSDLQCGGWCTALLNGRGEIYLKGKIDGEALIPRGVNHGFSKLKFPDGTEPRSTSIRQFSVGRKMVVALADDGTTWLWYGAAAAAFKVEIPRVAQAPQNKNLHVSQVVGGWQTVGVFVRGIGIIIWEYTAPYTLDGRANPEFMDANAAVVVPSSQHTAKKITKNRTAYGDKILTEAVADLGMTEDPDDPGEVATFILLENYTLFCTHKGMLLVHKPGAEMSLRLAQFSFVSDIQGSFRSFAIFTRDGAVFTMQQDELDVYWNAYLQNTYDTISKVTLFVDRIPALQNTGVIQVAFGDYHFHALHSDGRITSYGKDPGGCGALGLGRVQDHVNARGLVVLDRWTRDSALLDEAQEEGRAIWLLDDQRAWVEYLTQLADAEDDPQLDYAKLSSWVEQVGTGWGKDLPENEDHLGPFFALSVAAGGWRGGALVLVNDALVSAIKRLILFKVASVLEASDVPTGLEGTSRFRYLFAETVHGLPDAAFSTHGDDASSI